MAQGKTGKRGKSASWHRPSDKGQKMRTFRNKLRQRERHKRNYPNDTQSLAAARRWTTPATIAEANR